MLGPMRRWLNLLLVVALAATACGAANAAAPLPQDEQSRSTTSRPVETTTSTTTSTTTIATTTTTPDPNRTLIATARRGTTSLIVHESPGGPIKALPFRVPNPHQFGGPLTLMVTEGERGDDWVKVQLPIRPNGSEAWIESNNFFFTETFVRAEVELSTTTVRVFDGDELIAETQAAIGTEKTPTPLGTFFVAAKRINPPEEAYLGNWAIVLSSYSEALPTFSGALPVIAIHGANDPDRVLGRAISNGCVRVPNDVIDFMAEHVPLGAPVHIST